MSLANISLLLRFLAEGISAIKKFIADEEIKSAFKGLKDAKTDAEKQAVAKSIAVLLYK